MKPARRSAGDPSRPNSLWQNPRGVRPAIHPGQTACGKTHAAFGRRSIPAKQPVAKPTRRSAGDPSRLTASLRAAHRCVSVGIHPGQFSRWGLLPHAPCQPGASLASALTWVPPPAVHRVAARRSSLRFGRNTPGPVLPVGAPPSRALSAGRLAPTGRTGRSRRSRGFHHRLLRLLSSSLDVILLGVFAGMIFRRQRRDSAPAVHPAINHAPPSSSHTGRVARLQVRRSGRTPGPLWRA